ncbi:MAG TPA: hypothetical protein VER76_08760 [Pyrinomonadaceae bacterium]|nr:hypothetical protein [Pyrinomonadaceae bacterium]
MSYLIYFGMVVVAGCILTFVSNSFAYAMSRVVEAGFDFVEYRLALRARERQSLRLDARMLAGREAQVSNVTAFRTGEATAMVAAAARVAKGSTQQLGVARVAA